MIPPLNRGVLPGPWASARGGQPPPPPVDPPPPQKPDVTASPALLEGQAGSPMRFRVAAGLAGVKSVELVTQPTTGTATVEQLDVVYAPPADFAGQVNFDYRLVTEQGPTAAATLTAVVEHAYQELHTRGSFDPEVMSVVYLINAIGKPNGFQASLLAWIVTFSRHLLPRGPREQVYLVRNGEHTTTLTPVVGNEDGSAFAGSIFRRSVEVLAHKG